MSGRVGYSNVVTDGLVLYLDAGNRASYPGSGTAWRDLSAYKNNGTLTNGPTFSNANGGNIVFDGTDDYVKIDASWPTIFSLSIWVKPISSTERYGRILGTENDVFEIGLSPSMQISYFASTGAWINDIINVTSQQWINLLLIINNGTSIVYKNNALQYTGGAGNVTGQTGIYLGRRYISYEPGNIEINSIQIYNKQLSASEMSQNYNALKGRFGL